jgi:hypothetical protein
MKKIVLALVILIPFTPLVLKGQVEQYNLPPKIYYKRGKITLHDFTKYEGIQINIMSDNITFINSNTNLNQSLMLSNIDYLRVQEGNQALMWSGLGALLFGLSGLLAVMDEPYLDNPGGWVVGFTISGAAIGGLIGLAIPKWKTYYINSPVYK